MEMTPVTARAFWKALMDNAAALVNDAHILLRAGSFARARSLTVLAQEELGKALWLYDTFHLSWNTGDATPRKVPKLKSDGKNHVAKYMESFVFGQELAAFWGDFSWFEEPGAGTEEDWKAYFAERERQAKAAAHQANDDKMRGFYADVDSDTAAVLSPADIEFGTIAEELQTAAQVIEMLLIQDHSRMKLDAQTPYDSTHAQQHSLLPIAHPEDWEASSEAFRSGSYFRRADDE